MAGVRMPFRLTLLVAGVAVLVAAAAGFVAARRSPDAAPSPAPPPGAVASPDAVASPARKPRPRGGRVLELKEAFRELDVIRPSRQRVADDFTLPRLDRTTFRLRDHHGKVVLVNFWATWCPPCLAEMPAMERLWQQHRDGDFMMVAISVDADPAKVAPFVAQHKLTFPIVLDPTMQVASAYGVRALPSSFLVDRAGHLTGLAIGPRPWDNDASHSLVEGLVR
jgi:peroxiredoxin